MSSVTTGSSSCLGAVSPFGSLIRAASATRVSSHRSSTRTSSREVCAFEFAVCASGSARSPVGNTSRVHVFEGASYDRPPRFAFVAALASPIVVGATTGKRSTKRIGPRKRDAFVCETFSSSEAGTDPSASAAGNGRGSEREGSVPASSSDGSLARLNASATSAASAETRASSAFGSGGVGSATRHRAVRGLRALTSTHPRTRGSTGWSARARRVASTSGSASGSGVAESGTSGRASSGSRVTRFIPDPSRREHPARHDECGRTHTTIRLSRQKAHVYGFDLRTRVIAIDDVNRSTQAGIPGTSRPLSRTPFARTSSPNRWAA